VALVKAINDGVGIEEASVVFSFTPAAYIPCSGGALSRFTKDGNVYATKAYCVDTAMWEIGGVAVALRLIQLAKVMIDTISLNLLSHVKRTTDTARTLSNARYTH
jgi:hypothetical protein